MFKRVLLVIFLYITFLASSVLAQENFKITSLNFDTSNSMVFLTSSSEQSEIQEPILKEIKLVKLSEPNRAYFDIEHAILTTKKQNWYFSSGDITQVKLAQNSNDPDIVRVVLYFNEGFNPDKISFLRIKDDIVISLNNSICENEYFVPAYSEDKDSSSDFYQNLKVSNVEIEKIKSISEKMTSEDKLSQIQEAFDKKNTKADNIVSAVNSEEEAILKDFKLRSKYYLDNIYVSEKGVLASGFGAMNIESPMYLTDPQRVVFDIKNAYVNPDIRNKEFKINKTDSVRVGQFERSKARVVITSDNVFKYVPVFSSDNQSLLIANSKKTKTTSLFKETADIVSYYVKTVGFNSNEFIFALNSPVVHGVRREDSSMVVYLFNALRYNEKNFKDTIKNSRLADMEIELLPKVGLKLIIPIDNTSTVDTYLGSDGKALRLVTKNITKKSFFSLFRSPISSEKKVVIDAGHGGVDYGAVRAGINEKDIALDIAKRVEANLLSRGVEVYMVRRNDQTVSLKDRAMYTERNNPDVFVSVHVNSSVKPQIEGIETHYYHSKSLGLAQMVHSSMLSNVKAYDRGLFKSKFYVINHVDVPAILCEVGFLSNDKERSQLVSEKRKKQTAEAIAEGIWKYLQNQR